MTLYYGLAPRQRGLVDQDDLPVYQFPPDYIERLWNAIAGVDPVFADKVSELNVAVSMDELRSKSEVLAKLEREGTIKIVGAMYDVSDGRVRVIDVA